MRIKGILAGLCLLAAAAPVWADDAAQTAWQQKQAEITQLQTQLNEADVAAQQSNTTLEEAGRRLDAAWTAVRGQQR